MTRRITSVLPVSSRRKIRIGGENGQSLLHSSILAERDNLFKLLLEHDADVNLQDNDGNIPLHLAIRKSKETYFFLLIDSTDLSIRNKKQETCADVALKENNPKFLFNLLTLNAPLSMNITIQNLSILNMVRSFRKSGYKYFRRDLYLKLVEKILLNKIEIFIPNELWKHICSFL